MKTNYFKQLMSKTTIFSLCLLAFAACTEAQNKTVAKTALNKGVYRYVQPSATPDEDFYIVIDNASQGRIYGTSDLIEVNSRDSYTPGFFVANMNGIKMVGDSLYFSKGDYFTKPFPLALRSSAAVLKQGGVIWKTGSTFDVDKKATINKKFAAKVSGDSIVFYVDYLKAISGGKMVFKKEKAPTQRSRGALMK
jgi:hypothetical protein